jgi:primosomal protein N'
VIPLKLSDVFTPDSVGEEVIVWFGKDDTVRGIVTDAGDEGRMEDNMLTLGLVGKSIIVIDMTYARAVTFIR